MCADVLRFNQFSMLIFASNAELDRDWVVLLSSETRVRRAKK